MGTEAFIAGKQVRRLLLGEQVLRAAAVTPQSTHTPYFTISGGAVLVTSIVGIVTVAFTATATNIKLIAEPTTGTAGDICAVLAAANLEAGTLLTITGHAADAMIGVSAGGAEAQTRPIVLQPGTLDFSSSGNNATSQTKWYLHYIPLDDGASVTAA